MKASTILLLAASAVAVNAQADANVDGCIVQCALGVSSNPLEICKSEDLQKQLLECAARDCNLNVDDDAALAGLRSVCPGGDAGPTATETTSSAVTTTTESSTETETSVIETETETADITTTAFTNGTITTSTPTATDEATETSDVPSETTPAEGGAGIKGFSVAAMGIAGLAAALVF